MREMAKEMGDMLPRVRGITESVVAATFRACRRRKGHGFTVEDAVAGHRAVSSGKRVGIESVAGFSEGIIARAWCMAFSEAESGGEMVENCEVTF